MKQQEHLFEGEQELTQKTKKRRRLLKKIIRNNRQVASDKQFEILLNLDKQLFAGYNCHRLGNFCIQENRLDKAEQNLLRAKQLIQKKFLFSNIYLSLANLELKKKNIPKAIEYYETVLELSPHKDSKKYLNKDQVVFAGKLNSFNSYIEAHQKLTELYALTNQLEKAFDLCQSSLEFKQDEQSVIINFTDLLEKYGKKDEALTYAWKRIVEQTKKDGISELETFKTISIKPWIQPQKVQIKQKQINVFSIKWGSKYTFQDVNQLYVSLKKNTTWNVDFYCFTDDSYGINKQIKIKYLDDQWKKQWGKAVLFGEKIPGKKFYIDLNVVITGNLDKLFDYEGQFAILKNYQTANQKLKTPHKGYNSSVMIWKEQALRSIYEVLKHNFEIIERMLVKFDYWLDMTLDSVDQIDQLYQGKIINFSPEIKENLPEDVAIVCFSKKSQHSENLAQWIKKYR